MGDQDREPEVPVVEEVVLKAIAARSLPRPGSLRAELQDLKECLEDGYITKEEYEIKRATLLAGPTQTTGPSGEKDVLAKHFIETELRNLQPWRIDVQKFQTIRDGWAKITLEEKRGMFLRKAENQRLGATEAMLGMYLLYGGEDDLDFLRSLLVSSSGEQRMFMHNMYVATNREEVFMLTHGHSIARLTSPLFPSFASFNLLNDMILAEDVSGGGVERKPLFKESEEGDPLGGGITFPVLVNPDGSSFVDVTDMGEAVLLLQRQISSMTSMVQSLEAGKAQVSKSKSTYWKNRNQRAPAQQQQQHQYHNPQQQQQYHNPQQQAANYNPTYNQNGYRGNVTGGDPPTTPATTTKRGTGTGTTGP